MQQRDPQQGFRFPQNQQPVYRFPQNQQPMHGYEPQPGIANRDMPERCEDCPYRQESRKKARRRRFSLVRLAFTFIGVVTVLVMLIRYAVIPFLVYLNVLAGGTL